jgi:transposase
MLVHRGREEEDFTRDRSDFKDATIIAKKVTELRCYVPYQLEGHWCRLRHLGARRNDQLTAAGAARQGLRDLLECAWPTVLQAAADPLDALTFRAAMTVFTHPDNIVAMGFEAFAAAWPTSCPAGAGNGATCGSCARSGLPLRRRAGSEPNAPPPANAPLT